VEAVVHGETGLLVDSTDPEKIGDALIELLTDDHKLKQYGLKGKEFIRNNFREDMMLKNYINQIKEVAGI
jgi:glycosyltransferase involved in cell wall biosynthesis